LGAPGAIPLAELVTVGVLFWGIVCANAAADLLEGMVLQGHPFEESLRVMKRDAALQQDREPRSYADLAGGLEGSVVGLGEGMPDVMELFGDHERQSGSGNDALVMTFRGERKAGAGAGRLKL